MNTPYASYVDVLKRGHRFDEMEKNVPPEALIDLGLDPIVMASRDLDDAKKHLFYGKTDQFWETQGDYGAARDGRLKYNVVPTDVLHAIIGICAEAGELAELLMNALEQRRIIDADAVITEAGDICWYMQLLANALGVSAETFINRNIEKLDARFGGSFTPEKALARADQSETSSQYQ